MELQRDAWLERVGFLVQASLCRRLSICQDRMIAAIKTDVYEQQAEEAEDVQWK